MGSCGAAGAEIEGLDGRGSVGDWLVAGGRRDDREKGGAGGADDAGGGRDGGSAESSGKTGEAAGSGDPSSG